MGGWVYQIELVNSVFKVHNMKNIILKVTKINRNMLMNLVAKSHLIITDILIHHKSGVWIRLILNSHMVWIFKIMIMTI